MILSLQCLLPLKRKWIFDKDNVDILLFDNLSIEEVGMKVKEWCDFCIANYN